MWETDGRSVSSSGWCGSREDAGASRSGYPARHPARGDSLSPWVRPPSPGLLSPQGGRFPLQVGLIPSPLGSVAPPAAPAPFRAGSRGLGIGETLLGNFVPWLLADYVTKWKDITRISPTSWRENIATGPVWDDNHFHINDLLHPYQGSYYFVAGRSNNCRFEKPLLFTILGSAFWECCGESHSASASDLVTTTLGGTVIGEVFFRFGSQLLAEQRWHWELFAGVMTSTRAATRWVLGQRGHPIADDPLIQLRQTLDAHLALGTAFSQATAVMEIGAAYNTFDLLQKGDRPFNHYLAAA